MSRAVHGTGQKSSVIDRQIKEYQKNSVKYLNRLSLLTGTILLYINVCDGAVTALCTVHLGEAVS